MKTSQLKNQSTMSNQTKLFFLIFAVALLSAGCGPKKYLHTADQGDLSSETLDSQKAIAACSIQTNGSSALSFRIKPYSAGSSQDQIRYMMVRIDRIPTDFSSDETNGIEVYTWNVDNSGLISSPNQASIGVYSLAQSGQYQVPQYSVFTFKDMKAAGATSASQFFAQKGFLIDTMDSSGNAKILTVVLNKGAADARTITYKGSALIPTFYASPDDYLESGKPQSLLDLHPLLSLKGQNLTKAQYESEAAKYCF